MPRKSYPRKRKNANGYWRHFGQVNYFRCNEELAEKVKGKKDCHRKCENIVHRERHSESPAIIQEVFCRVCGTRHVIHLDEPKDDRERVIYEHLA